MHKVIQDLHEPLLRRFLYEIGFDNCNIEYIYIHELEIIEVWCNSLLYTLNVSEILQIDAQFRSDYLKYHALSFTKHIEEELIKMKMKEIMKKQKRLVND